MTQRLCDPLDYHRGSCIPAHSKNETQLVSATESVLRVRLNLKC